MTVPALPLVLASGSPRRRELLRRAGVPFETRAADLDEAPLPDEAPEALALRLAGEKALAIAGGVPPEPHRLVLGADTIVVLGAVVLGKPRDEAHAEETLARLVGRTHHVITAVAVAASGGGLLRSLAVRSEVRMRAASAEEIRRYVATGEPLDKAGAYAAQGEGRRFIEAIDGSETNVIGLPMDETLALLRELGLGIA